MAKCLRVGTEFDLVFTVYWKDDDGDWDGGYEDFATYAKAMSAVRKFQKSRPDFPYAIRLDSSRWVSRFKANE
jgi:hypothetical protein